MRFTIVGAGAIGAIVGAHLAGAGHEIVFVEANEAHLAAIRRVGLHLGGAADLTFRPEVFAPHELQGPQQHVLLAVKARHTLEALRPVAPLLEPSGYVVSLQNGLEEYKIASLVGKARTIGAYLTFGGHYRAPGEVIYGGPGSFCIGELDGRMPPRLAQLQAALSAVQPVEATANIFGYLWAKMALGAVYFATALVSADVPEIYSHARYRAMLGALAAEVVAVAEARHVAVETCDGFDPKVFGQRPGDADAVDASWEAQRRYWGRHVGGRTGVWRDLAQHKRPTEVNEQVAVVVDLAAEAGVAVPRLTALVELIRGAEGGRELGAHNLDALAALHERLGAGLQQTSA